MHLEVNSSHLLDMVQFSNGYLQTVEIYRSTMPREYRRVMDSIKAINGTHHMAGDDHYASLDYDPRP